MAIFLHHTCAGLYLLVGAFRVSLSTSMLLPTAMSPHVFNGTLSALGKGTDHCVSVLPAFQLHARSVVSDCMLRFYAFVCREHPMEQAALDFAITRAAAPVVDDFDAFMSWCSKQESCGIAVACAVAHMLRQLHAAGDCPGLRKTLHDSAASDRGTAAPLHSLLNDLRKHSLRD
jgi:hypothetical protein